MVVFPGLAGRRKGSESLSLPKRGGLDNNPLNIQADTEMFGS
jgi:hypothetical protein